MKRFGKAALLLPAVLAWARPSPGAEVKTLAAAVRGASRPLPSFF